MGKPWTKLQGVLFWIGFALAPVVLIAIVVLVMSFFYDLFGGLGVVKG